jgi:hypothetical protein
MAKVSYHINLDLGSWYEATAKTDRLHPNHRAATKEEVELIEIISHAGRRLAKLIDGSQTQAEE